MSFLYEESGAVTVDWVVLTAALVGLGLAAMSVVSGGVEDLSNDVDAQLNDNTIIKTSFDGLPDWQATFLTGLAARGAEAHFDLHAGLKQTDLDADLAGSTEDLLAAYSEHAGYVEGILVTAGIVRENAGNYHDMAAALNAENGSTFTASTIELILGSNNFEGDPENWARSLEIDSQVEAEINAYRAHELKRRGELPPG